MWFANALAVLPNLTVCLLALTGCGIWWSDYSNVVAQTLMAIDHWSLSTGRHAEISAHPCEQFLAAKLFASPASLCSPGRAGDSSGSGKLKWWSSDSSTATGRPSASTCTICHNFNCIFHALRGVSPSLLSTFSVQAVKLHEHHESMKF